MLTLKCWTKSTVVLLALAQAAHADVTVSQSNNASAAISENLTQLFGQENAAIDAVESGRFNQLVAPPAAKTADKAGAAQPMTFDAAWIQSIPAAAQSSESQCLAKAIYFEARGESIRGQAAVAEVVLNRVDSGAFPRTVCGVVNQSGGGGCQFSFICDGVADRVSNRQSWMIAERIAGAFLAGAPRGLTDGATYFRASTALPAWAKRFDKTAQIGRHVFYREPIRTAMN